MEIRFGESMTKEEFLQAAKLGSRRIRSRTSFSIDMWLLQVLAGSLMMFSGGWLVFFKFQFLGFILFVAGLFVLVFGIKLRKSLEEFWQKNEILNMRREGVINDDGIESSTPKGSSRLEWADFSGFGEYKDVFVLFQGTSVGTVFSRRFFQSDEDWRQFKDFAVKKLKRTHQVKLDRTYREKENFKTNWLVWLLLIVAIIAMLIGGFRNQ